MTGFKYEIVPATDEHLMTVARNMRLDDRREIWASNKMTPHRAMLQSKRAGAEVWAGTVDGEAVCVFGIVPVTLLSKHGIIWLLGTEGVETHARVFLRMNKEWLAEAKGRWLTLSNMVDKRNTAALRWVRWLGGKFSDPTRRNGVVFMPFKIERDDV